MRYGSLFTGTGQLDVGLHLAGLTDLRWVCESDEWRRETILARRFPDAVRHADVRAVGADTAELVELIAGGFPCKGASTAGKRGGFDHPETVLWREMFRAVRELRPRYVLIENVANLLTMARAPGEPTGTAWGEVLADLASLGFDVEWDCIPAGAVGAPHLRDRVYAVAVANADSAHGEGHWSAERVQAQVTGDHGSGVGTAADSAGQGGATGWGRERSGSRELGQRWRNHAQPSAQASAHAGGGGVRQQPEPERGRDGAPVAGRAGAVAADAEGGPARREPAVTTRRLAAEPHGVPVEWGDYGPAIRRWEAIHGPAPEPLVCRVDDGDPKLRRVRARVDRSRLSALGDGVQVQVGMIVGEHILALEAARQA